MKKLIGKRRDKATNRTSIAVASEKEEISNESVLIIKVFSDGMRYC